MSTIDPNDAPESTATDQEAAAVPDEPSKPVQQPVEAAAAESGRNDGDTVDAPPPPMEGESSRQSSASSSSASSSSRSSSRAESVQPPDSAAADLGKEEEEVKELDEFDASRIQTPHQLRVYRTMPGYRYKMPALQKWKRVAHSIIIWLRLYHFHSSQVREILRFFSDTDLLSGVVEETNFEELLFSVHSFRPNKQARVNIKTLQLMQIDPKERKQADSRPIEAGLRGYEAFAKYPPNILKKIAEKAWFQEFDRHSVIVREGDHPLYYYFIIYGSALVSIIDRKKMMARVAAILNRGDSFGELAIMDKLKRASTVIAREKCGLMMLEDKDYLEIFMQGGVKFLDNSFVKNHVLFREFNLSVLKANPRLVKLNYFPAGVTIVEDSRLSYWIFLVISGKATVKMAVHRSVLERQEETVVDPNEQERRRLLEDYHRGGIGHQTLIRRNWRRHLLQQDRLSKRADFDGNLELRQLGLARQGGLVKELSVVGRETTRLTAAARSSSDRSVLLPPLTKAYLVAPKEKPAGAAKQATDSSARKLDNTQQKQQGQKITYVTGKEAVLGRRTLATDLNREFFEQVEMKLLVGEFEEESLFQYMPVQVLERGMLFGFADHFFENQPALKLISKSCELLCIRRELYFDNAGEITLFEVGKSLRPYPSEMAVLSKNKEVQAWTEVRARHFSETITDMARKTVDVHDALTRFPEIKTTR